jgi:hypothetical protein
MTPIVIGNSPSASFGTFQSPGGGVDWNTVLGGPLNPSNGFGGLLGGGPKPDLSFTMPTAPANIPLYDPTAVADMPIDLSGIDMYRQMAERTGPSTWANLAKESGALQTQNQQEQAQQTAAGQTAAAENALASNGGLSSGARERAEEGGETNYLDMSQNLERQNNMNNLQIGINDNQNQVQQLGALPGLENTALQPLFQQAGMIAQNNQAQNAYNMNVFNQGNQAIAANQQAIATENSGKK